MRAGLTPVDPVVTPKVIGEYLAAGFTVVVPDYEEEQFANDAGQEEGYATLDGIRAAEHRLGVPEASTPVGLVGFSGGATATDYATELAPTYAPDPRHRGRGRRRRGCRLRAQHRLRERQRRLVSGDPGRVGGAEPGVPHRPRQVPVAVREGKSRPRSPAPAWAAWPCHRAPYESCSSPSTGTFSPCRSSHRCSTGSS